MREKTRIRLIKESNSAAKKHSLLKDLGPSIVADFNDFYGEILDIEKNDNRISDLFNGFLGGLGSCLNDDASVNMISVFINKANEIKND